MAITNIKVYRLARKRRKIQFLVSSISYTLFSPPIKYWIPLAADLASFGAPEKVTVEERCTGGAVKQLNIAYEKGNVTLFSEYNVRTVLGAAATNVTGKDGEPVDMALLPSAYCSVTPTEEGFVVYGGGYGHGIGMSQNGAGIMASKGKSFEEILRFFFSGIELETISVLSPEA